MRGTEGQSTRRKIFVLFRTINRPCFTLEKHPVAMYTLVRILPVAFSWFNKRASTITQVHARNENCKDKHATARNKLKRMRVIQIGMQLQYSLLERKIWKTVQSKRTLS